MERERVVGTGRKIPPAAPRPTRASSHRLAPRARSDSRSSSASRARRRQRGRDAPALAARARRPRSRSRARCAAARRPARTPCATAKPSMSSAARSGKRPRRSRAWRASADAEQVVSSSARRRAAPAGAPARCGRRSAPAAASGRPGHCGKPSAGGADELRALAHADAVDRDRVELQRRADRRALGVEGAGDADQEHARRRSAREERGRARRGGDRPEAAALEQRRGPGRAVVEQAALLDLGRDQDQRGGAERRPPVRLAVHGARRVSRAAPSRASARGREPGARGVC